MSWNFGHIIFAHDFQNEQADFLNALGLQPSSTPGRLLAYDEVISGDFHGSAMAFHCGKTLVAGFDLGQRTVISFPHLSTLDKNLMRLSEHGDIMGFYLQGNIGHYGWAYFHGGKRVRVHKSQEGTAVVDDGALFPEENPDEHPSTNLFNLSRRVLGVQADRLIFEPGILFSALTQST